MQKYQIKTMWEGQAETLKVMEVEKSNRFKRRNKRSDKCSEKGLRMEREREKERIKA